MGLFHKLFGLKTPEEKTQEKISKAIELFTGASLGIITDTMLNENDNSTRAAMYFFGAIDYLSQNNNIPQIQTYVILSLFLERTFQLSKEESIIFAKELMDNTMTGKYLEFMNIGGSAMHNWLNGNIHAPIELFKILEKD